MTKGGNAFCVQFCQLVERFANDFKLALHRRLRHLVAKHLQPADVVSLADGRYARAVLGDGGAWVDFRGIGWYRQIAYKKLACNPVIALIGPRHRLSVNW